MILFSYKVKANFLRKKKVPKHLLHWDYYYYYILYRRHSKIFVVWLCRQITCTQKQERTKLDCKLLCWIRTKTVCKSFFIFLRSVFFIDFFLLFNHIFSNLIEIQFSTIDSVNVHVVRVLYSVFFFFLLLLAKSFLYANVTSSYFCFRGNSIENLFEWWTEEMLEWIFLSMNFNASNAK